MAIPIGVQLYSVREDCARDLPGTLAAVAKMGYDGVEFAGYHGRDAQGLRKLLDDLGLKCCGTHTKLDTLLGDELDKTVEFNRVLGNKFLIVPSLPEPRRAKSKAIWLDTAKVFNEVCARAGERGMHVGYHAHYIDFFKADDGGEVLWDILFGNTGDLVMQLDTGNALYGGYDPVAILKRYPGRSLSVHLKGYSASAAEKWSFVGEGDVNWPGVFAACESVGGTQWYVVEQESYPVPPLKSIERCLENLRKMGK